MTEEMLFMNIQKDKTTPNVYEFKRRKRVKKGKKKKPDPFSFEINEYGEIPISSKTCNIKTPYDWAVQFFKAMVVFFLVTVLLITFFNSGDH